MRLPTRTELFHIAEYIWHHFAVPIVFYIAFRSWGAKVAIGFAIAVTCIQLFIAFIQRKRPSPFFLIAAIFTVGFGGIDLIIPNPKFFRLEPFVQNLIVGTLFLVTTFTKTPIIGQFAKALPTKFQPDLSKIHPSYMKNLTMIWAIYLLLKAFIFLYLALNVDLGSLIVLRPIIGGGTLFCLIVGEMVYRKRVWRAA